MELHWSKVVGRKVDEPWLGVTCPGSAGPVEAL
jgi:hypothetical protein